MKEVFAIAIGVVAALFIYAFVLGFFVYIYPKFPVLIQLYVLFAVLCYFLMGIGLIVTTISLFFGNKDAPASFGYILLMAIILFFPNNYILYMSRVWSIHFSEPEMYVLQRLNLIVGGFLSYISSFFAAIFHFDADPVNAFADGFKDGLKPDPDATASGTGLVGFSGKVLANVLLGVVSGVIGTLLIKNFSAKKS